jgi:hypothetical protein
VLRLKQLEFNFQIRLHFVHVAGSRIQAQGTDGLSWGSPFLLGQLHSVPLHYSPSAITSHSEMVRVFSPPICLPSPLV